MPVQPIILYDNPAIAEDITRALLDEQPMMVVGRAARVLAQMLGGVVEPMLSREEKGETEIYRLSAGREDALFGQLPETFRADCYRVDDITQLPLQAVPLANSECTQFQAFKLAGKPVYGVQFEPDQTLQNQFIRLYSQQ